MNASKQVAKHFREVFFGGNWTTVNLKDTLADVTWQQALTQVYTLNTIATLTCHMTYYVSAVSKVLQGEPLNASDKLSFNHPPIESEDDWQQLLKNIWHEAEKFSLLIENLPEDKLWEDFDNGNYGIYYRNLNGIIEHTHYHLGQIVILKKILVANA
ncbi:DUF1572 domain-containing protein [Flavobacterium zepuense]|uniref:DUF1572 domain-containing protein n=1 Tax=Flavobacterium zepuense TaxID=2593302 RepID=A0A552V1B7_9FLAO|nr:DUF1572 domain-containing protein [Flavobacterium zepuense]TRW24247.1 DUF1572 domain-containing protein [Flavobacterium zepuense]